MKKKILIIGSMFILLFTGCETTKNTPSKKVEEFLGRYQSMDSGVLTQLDNVVSEETTMSDEQKKEYKSLMEKQYQNLSYKIKNEEINDDTATVEVEIEVYDYATSVSKSRKYYEEHPDEFKEDKNNDNKNNNDNDNNNDNVVEDALRDTAAYIDYKIKQLKDVTDKAKYDITFNLTKEDDEWRLEDISDIDRKKIHGLYEE